MQPYILIKESELEEDLMAIMKNKWQVYGWWLEMFFHSYGLRIPVHHKVESFGQKFIIVSQSDYKKIQDFISSKNK